jgi:hypothetical protein
MTGDSRPDPQPEHENRHHNGDGHGIGAELTREHAGPGNFVDQGEGAGNKKDQCDRRQGKARQIHPRVHSRFIQETGMLPPGMQFNFLESDGSVSCRILGGQN